MSASALRDRRALEDRLSTHGYTDALGEDLDLEKHGERAAGTITPVNALQSLRNTLRFNGTANLNSQAIKAVVRVRVYLNTIGTFFPTVSASALRDLHVGALRFVQRDEHLDLILRLARAPPGALPGYLVWSELPVAYSTRYTFSQCSQHTTQIDEFPISIHNAQAEKKLIN